jgi:predicted RNase H-like HicB family nuclease
MTSWVIRQRNLKMETTIPPYEMIIYWSKRDDAFLVEVPELPGCMADGQTQEEALANAKVVIGHWIEIATELGWEIPVPKGRLMYA